MMERSGLRITAVFVLSGIAVNGYPSFTYLLSILETNLRNEVHLDFRF